MQPRESGELLGHAQEAGSVMATDSNGPGIPHRTLPGIQEVAYVAKVDFIGTFFLKTNSL